ncbi:MAG: DUF5591 domain-containing protein [Candidatus Thermoplasmatota archaeon]|nr:DUF5591 domain-containing protein [Candidatus Thermoplasmatota archaeon]
MIKDNSIFCFARTGDLDGLEYPAVLDTTKDIETHNGILHVLGRSVNTDGIISNINMKNYYVDDSGEICVIPDAISLVMRPKKLLQRIFLIRKELGNLPLIYAPSIGEPYLIPALVYAGISLFDDALVRNQSMRGTRYTVLGSLKDKETLSANMAFLDEMLSSLRKAIASQTLREVVEKYQFSSKAVEIIRSLDIYFPAESERYFPSRTPYIKANGIISLNRPDLRKYREKISNEYRRPEGKEICLLLPCSARKPYSASSLHRRIIGRIGKYLTSVHRVVVTSPVGLVPEELEGMYPARFYDIPVIGEWFEDEKMIIRDMLRSYFRRNSYAKVIAYIQDDLSFIEDSLPNGSTIIKGRIRNGEMLDMLENELSKEVLLKETVQNEHISRLKSMARFQFGDWIEPLIASMRYTRSYNQDMLTLGGKAMLVHNERTGKLSVTRAMAVNFVEMGRFTVTIDDFKPTANIYAVGVKAVTEDIRQEDEVAIAYDHEVRGVGVAKMPAPFMLNLKKGVAVKVRN